MQESILRFFQSIQHPVLDKFFTYITLTGEQYIIIIVVSWLYWNVSKRKGIVLTLLFLISGMVNSLMKVLFHTPRPFQKLDNFEAQRIHTATGHSFPSGHTQGATTLFVSLAMLFRQRSFIIAAVIVPILVAISRMYLGVHWPIDVVGGMLLACLVVFSLLNYLNKLYDKKSAFIRFRVKQKSWGLFIKVFTLYE